MCVAVAFTLTVMTVKYLMCEQMPISVESKPPSTNIQSHQHLMASALRPFGVCLCVCTSFLVLPELCLPK